MTPAITHFEALLLFSLVISAAFAFHSRTTPGARLFYAVKTFLMFVGVGVLIGWLMFPLSR